MRQINRALSANYHMCRALVLREAYKLLREPARVFGMIAQPLIIWGLFSYGFDSGFQLAGKGGSSFLQEFYPGMVMMTLLFSAIFSSMSVIEDRHSGLLQAALSSRAHRVAIVLGKCIGVILLSLVQFALLLLVTFSFVENSAQWNLLAIFSWAVVSCFSLIPVNIMVALWLGTTQGYHAFMGAVLLPAWALSGSVFPVDQGVLQYVAMWNPMTYMVDGFRFVFGVESTGSHPQPFFGYHAIGLIVLGITGLFVSAKVLERTAVHE